MKEQQLFFVIKLKILRIILENDLPFDHEYIKNKLLLNTDIMDVLKIKDEIDEFII